jgi:hypothetical protein
MARGRKPVRLATPPKPKQPPLVLAPSDKPPISEQERRKLLNEFIDRAVVPALLERLKRDGLL